MVCQLCQIETTATLCQVCQYLAEVAPPSFPMVCRHCQAPLAKAEETGTLCRLCRDLLRTVRQSSWLAFAHAEWEQENLLLAKRKRELI